MPRRRSTTDDYVARIDRVLDHIHERLADAPALAELARVACFSPFHFHRVFRAMTGETVREAVARLRVERVAFLLGRAGSGRTLTEIAFACGYSSPAELSRAFRARFATTPSAFRREMRKNPQAAHAPRPYLHGRDASRLVARVVVAPRRHIAYVRVTDPFAPGRVARAHEALRAWAEARRHAAAPMLGLSHDDPEVTPLARCRYDIGCVVPPTTRGGGGVSVRALPGGTYVEARASGAAADVARTWDRLFAEWLPRSGYEPADGPGIEQFVASPDFDRWDGLDVVLALPVVRARR
jgi:AraC family transcriptional regulator